MSRVATLALLVFPLLLVAACEQRVADAVPPPAAAAEEGDASVLSAATQADVVPQGASPGATSVAAAEPETVIASAPYSINPNIRAELLEVRRVSGGALRVKWRIVNTVQPQASGSPAATAEEPINYNFSWDDLYYVDPAENKKYGYLTDSEGGRILDVWWGNLKPGEARSNWAKFPAPPPSSNTISLTLPKFPPFEDVPVSQ